MYPFIQKWHRKLGLYTALFVIFLVISGIVLNHSEGLNLNSKFVQLDWILDHYQINPDIEPIGFNVANFWVTQFGDRIYFNDVEVANDVNHLFGSVFVNDSYVVAYDGQLTLVTSEGEIIEHLAGAEGVPAGMKAVGIDEQDNIIIKAAHGDYQVNIDELDWNEQDHFDATWSKPTDVPEQLNNKLLKKYRGSGLSLERLLLDFHSGRIVGQWGVYFVDLVAIIFLILSITGVCMWWMRK
jgi:PepSY-associated TM region